MKATKRTNMKHFLDIPDSLFEKLLLLGPDRLTLKLDGFLASFGKNESGEPFFESARSGPIYEMGAFEKFSVSKRKPRQSIIRARHYDSLMSYIFNSKIMQNLEKLTKVTGEFFYMPMASDVDSTFVKFVNVPYDKKKLGELLTVFPYSGPDILGLSTDEFKIISPCVNMRGSIPGTNKTQVADYIINNLIGEDVIGPFIEGVVVHIENTQWKIQSKFYKDYLDGTKRASNRSIPTIP